MTTENEKRLTPKQASEAVAQRPSTQNPTADTIVEQAAGAGNLTSSKFADGNSRADALEQPHHVVDFSTAVICEMAELSDRNSPEDEPDAMIANDDEVRGCIGRALEQTGLVLAASPVEQPAAAEAVALYQYRTRPDWKDQWSEWEECSAAAAADYIRVPRLHDWHYEVRALYTAPQPPAQADHVAGGDGEDCPACTTIEADYRATRVAGLTDEQRASCAVAADLAHANGLKSIANDLRVLATHPGQPELRAKVTEAVRTYPDELTDTLRHVLGFPNFRCAPYAHLMRAAGADIKTKAEDEQAHVLHWLVKLVIDHGERWADIADEELTAMRGKVDAAGAGESQ
ncbi:hypothetical protein [Burkholderia stagnalis]